MAIDYSKLRPSDFRPERDSEFRAETNFLQRQEDRTTRLQKEEGQAQVEAEEPLAKFEQELAKTIERNRKNAESAEDRQLRLTRQQQADIDKETSKFVATTTREDRATTQANQKAESRLAALGKTGRSGLVFNTIEEAEQYNSRPDTDFVDYASGGAEAFRNKASSLGLSVVDPASLPQPVKTRPAQQRGDELTGTILKRSPYGVAVGSDGSIVVSDKFMQFALNPDLDPATLAKNISRTFDAFKKEANPTQNPNSEINSRSLAPEDIEQQIRTLRASDVRTRDAVRKILQERQDALSKYKAREEKIQQIQGGSPGQQTQRQEGTPQVGEPLGGGESSELTFVQNVISQIDRLRTEPELAAETFGEQLAGQTDAQSVAQRGAVADELQSAIDQQERYKRTEELAARMRLIEENKDKLAESLVRQSPNLELRTIRKELDDDSLMANEALEQWIVNRGVPLTPQEADIINSRSNELSANAAIADDYEKARDQAVREYLKSQDASLDDRGIDTMGLQHYAMRHMGQLDQDNSPERVAREALRHWASESRQIFGGQAFESDQMVNPLDALQWVHRPETGKYVLQFIDPTTKEGYGNGYEVDFMGAHDNARRLGVTPEQYLDALALPLRQGNLGDSRDTNTLFAYDPINQVLVENATIGQGNSASYFDDALLERSIEQARKAGAPQEQIDATVKEVQRIRDEASRIVVSDLLQESDAMALVSDTPLEGIIPKSVKDNIQASTAVNFRQFYNIEKKAGKEDQEIIRDYMSDVKDKKISMGVNMALARWENQWNRIKLASEQWTKSALSLLPGVNLNEGQGQRYASEWEALNKRDQLITSAVGRAGSVAEWAGEFGSLALQLGESAISGGLGSLAGRGAARLLATRAATIAGTSVALRSAEVVGAVARPGITSRIGQGVTRLLTTESATLARLGAGTANSMYIAMQSMPQTYGDVFTHRYQQAREMINNDPLTRNMAEGMKDELAQNRATTTASIAAIGNGIFSVMLNNRAGANRFIRRLTGAREVGTFGKAMDRVESRLRVDTARDGVVLALAKRVGTIALHAVEGGTEEVADEALQWAATALGQSGQIRESDIAKTEDVVDAAAKIFILGAVAGGLTGAAADIRKPVEAGPFGTAEAMKSRIFAGDLNNSQQNLRAAAESLEPSNPITGTTMDNIKRVGDVMDSALNAQQNVTRIMAEAGIADSPEARARMEQNTSVLPQRLIPDIVNFAEAVRTAKSEGRTERVGEMVTEAINSLDTTGLSEQQQQVLATVLEDVAQQTPEVLGEMELDQAGNFVPASEADADILAAADMVQTEAPVAEEATPAAGTTEVTPVEATQPATVEAPAAEEAAPVELQPRDTRMDAATTNPVMVPFQTWLDSGQTAVPQELASNAHTLLEGLRVIDPEMAQFVERGNDEVGNVTRQTIENLLVLTKYTAPDGPIATDVRGKSTVVAPLSMVYDPSVYSDFNTPGARTTNSRWVSSLRTLAPKSAQSASDVVANLVNDSSIPQSVRNYASALHSRLLELGVEPGVGVVRNSGNFNGAKMTAEDGSHYIMLNESGNGRGTSPALVMIHEMAHVLDDVMMANPEYRRNVEALKEGIREVFPEIRTTIEGLRDSAVRPEEAEAYNRTLQELETILGLRGDAELDTSSEFLPSFITNPLIARMVNEMAGREVTVEDLADPSFSLQPSDLTDITAGEKSGNLILNVWNRIKDLAARGREKYQSMMTMGSEEWNAYLQSMPEAYAPRVTYSVPADPTRMKRVKPSMNLDDGPAALDYRDFGIKGVMSKEGYNYIDSFMHGLNRLIGTRTQKITRADGRRIRELATNVAGVEARMTKRMKALQKHLTRWTRDMDPETRQVLQDAVRDYTGNMNNPARPEVIQGIHEEANRKAAMALTTFQAEVSSARNKLQDVMKRERTKLIAKRAQLDMLTSSQFLNSLETRIAQAVNNSRPASSMRAMSNEFVKAMRMLDQEFEPLFQETNNETELSEQYSRLYEATARELAEQFADRYRGSRQILNQLMAANGLRPETESRAFADILSESIQLYRRKQLANDPESNTSLKAIQDARQEYQKRVAHAREKYEAQTRRAVASQDGTIRESGSIWRERDRLIRMEHQAMEAAYQKRREDARMIIESTPWAKYILNELDAVIKTIAQNQIDIYHHRGNEEMKNRAQSLAYLSRTFLATGPNAKRFQSEITKALASDPEQVSRYTTVMGIVSDAIASHIKENKHRLNRGASQVMDNLYALARYADKQGYNFAGVMPQSLKPVFRGADPFLTNGKLGEAVLNSIRDADPRYQVSSDAKGLGPRNMADVYEKAMAALREVERMDAAERRKAREEIRVIRKEHEILAQDRNMMDNIDGAEGSNLSEWLAQNKDNPSGLPNWIDYETVKSLKHSEALNYLRNMSAAMMARNGLGNIVDPINLDLMSNNDVAEEMTNTARLMLTEYVNKTRNEENPFAQRKNLTESQRQILGELGHFGFEDIFTAIMNTTNIQNRNIINNVLPDMVSSELLADGLLSEHETADQTVQLSFANKALDLNEKWADKRTADTLYRTYRPNDEVLKVNKSLATYWKDNNFFSTLYQLSGVANLTTLVAAPASMFRNLAGTVLQGLNAGVTPLNAKVWEGTGEEVMLVKDLGQLQVGKMLNRIFPESEVGPSLMAEANKRLEEKLERYTKLGLLDAGQATFFREQMKKGIMERAEISEAMEAGNQDSLYSTVMGEIDKGTPAHQIWDSIKSSGTWAKNMYTGFLGAASNLYSMPDVLAKVIVYKNEQRTVRRMAEAEAKAAQRMDNPPQNYLRALEAYEAGGTRWENYVNARAAERAKTLLPTGARTPDWVKKASLLGLPFFSFTWHTLQSLPYAASYTFNELKAAKYEPDPSKRMWLYFDASRRMGGIITARVISGYLNYFVGNLMRSALEALSGGDDEDKDGRKKIVEGIVGDREFNRWLAQMGWAADYDVNGNLDYYYDTVRKSWMVQDTQFITPFKTEIDLLQSAFSALGRAIGEQKSELYERSFYEEVQNTLEDLAGSPSMLLSRLYDMVKGDTRYGAELELDQSWDAVVNALSIMVGLEPTVGDGKTWPAAERMAKFVSSYIPYVPSGVSLIQQGVRENPDVSLANMVLKFVGTGLRREKKVSDVVAKLLAASKAELNKARNGIRVINDLDLFNKGLPDQTVNRWIQFDIANYQKKAVEMANRFLVARSMCEALNESEGLDIFQQGLDTASISQNYATYVDARTAPPPITKTTVSNRIQELEQKMDKPGASQEYKDNIQKHIDALYDFYDQYASGIDIDTSMYDTDTIERTIKVNVTDKKTQE